MMWGDGYGLSRRISIRSSLMDFHRGWRRRANDLSETTKLFLMIGTYINNNLWSALLRQGDEHRAAPDRRL